MAPATPAAGSMVLGNAHAARYPESNPELSDDDRSEVPMKIERIGLSLDSIAEERRRQQRELPADENPFDDLAEADGLGEVASAAAPQGDSPFPHIDDPTARLRVDRPEDDPLPTSRAKALDAFTHLDPPEPPAITETEL